MKPRRKRALLRLWAVVCPTGYLYGHATRWHNLAENYLRLAGKGHESICFGKHRMIELREVRR